MPSTKDSVKKVKKQKADLAVIKPIKTKPYNDIDLNNWKLYENIKINGKNELVLWPIQRVFDMRRTSSRRYEMTTEFRELNSKNFQVWPHIE